MESERKKYTDKEKRRYRKEEAKKYITINKRNNQIEINNIILLEDFL